MDVTQKPGVQFLGGVPVFVPNEVRQSDPSFYISFNSSPRDYGCKTTALVVKDPEMTKFYILCGDHRKQYEEAKTLEASLTYFRSLPEKHHEFSDKL